MNEKVSYDIHQIMDIMAHRYPVLLIDKIVEMIPGEKVIGIKNVTVNEPYFQGHFPKRPVMPGVLIIEAMAQAGGFLILNTVEDPLTKNMFFASIERARFRKPVVPGDQLRMELIMVKYRLNTCKIEGKAFVGDEVVAELAYTASVVPREL
ncbi:MAG TPA: 3-hydroxyacyl-ACP dehydratase FabZ [Candidatus Marinimicrobia bacterium]|nr:3-hydroxyacyl-ACP dehydratase FabZ [Candidatus Neomarinimicrobiota bacterium]HIC51485.1 3-hydroxyacyl-ACP dehydratase FabZ [Candidatus Neomarinimicrobiota bacterium]HIM83086.1 3-hydroxyacyl-ACP dehydratase FabZ [Candidatus Neomarinimicrobiota bacterium]HIN46000.1 3-hydroxyacyl-ACP dehydratase FabZ [Candidatus Neomarinimicrobiota bacterium]